MITKYALTVPSGDRKAMLVATLCFIHCAVGPMLLSLAGFSSLVGASEKVETVFVVSSVVLGGATLIPGYRRKHRRCACLALFVGGLLCLVIFRRLHGIMVPDTILTGVGAGLIIGAHVLNLKFSRRCECCKSQPSGVRSNAVPNQR